MQKSGTFPYLSTNYQWGLRPEFVEPVLYRNRHKIHAFAWISFEIKRIAEKTVDQVYISDMSTMFRTNQNRYFGVTPFTYDTTNDASQFLSMHYQHNGY